MSTQTKITSIKFEEKPKSRYLTVEGFSAGNEKISILICCQGRLARGLDSEKKETLERGIGFLRAALKQLEVDETEQ